MSKRFTGTEKWSHGWFRKLLPKLKCVWFYLLDKCDHAGVWIADFEAVSFHVGEEITESDLSVFGDKLKKFDGDKYFIPTFIEFQYGELNPENRVHFSVISKLEKQGLYKPLISSLKGAMDKEKDKDKVKAKKEESENFLKAYAAYPVRTKGAKAAEQFNKQIKTDQDFRDLMTSIHNYKDHLAKPENNWRKPKQSFAAYLGTEATGFFWQSWISPDAGTSSINQKQTADVSKYFGGK